MKPRLWKLIRELASDIRVLQTVEIVSSGYSDRYISSNVRYTAQLHGATVPLNTPGVGDGDFDATSLLSKMMGGGEKAFRLAQKIISRNRWKTIGLGADGKYHDVFHASLSAALVCISSGHEGRPTRTPEGMATALANVRKLNAGEAQVIIAGMEKYNDLNAKRPLPAGYKTSNIVAVPQWLRDVAAGQSLPEKFSPIPE